MSSINYLNGGIVRKSTVLLFLLSLLPPSSNSYPPLSKPLLLQPPSLSSSYSVSSSSPPPQGTDNSTLSQPKYRENLQEKSLSAIRSLLNLNSFGQSEAATIIAWSIVSKTSEFAVLK